MFSVDEHQNVADASESAPRALFGLEGDLAQSEGLLLSLCVCFNLSLCQVAVFIQTAHHQISRWEVC